MEPLRWHLLPTREQEPNVADTRKPVVINRNSAPKPFGVLANQLREAILRGDISEGDSPSDG